MKYNSPHYPIHHVIDNNPYIKQIDAVERMAEQLHGWNLKYIEFPDIKTWLDSIWTAPYGKEQALDFLYKSVSHRADSYWNVQPQRYSYVGKELDESARKWRSVVKDLKGEFSKQVLSAKWKMDDTSLEPMRQDSKGYYEIDSLGVKHYIDNSPLKLIDDPIFTKPTKDQNLKNPFPKYKLINAEKEFKNSYPSVIPLLTLRKSLKPKHYAKVIFQGKPRERMWIKITKLIPGGYEGILDNSPTYLKNVKYGDVIRIKYGDIIGIMKPPK